MDQTYHMGHLTRYLHCDGERAKDPLIFRANIGGISEAMMVVEKLISGELMKLNIPVNEIFVADISRKQFLLIIKYKRN